MKARYGAQSPGLEISIWVTAHKHLPNCVQRSTGIRSEVMKVFIQQGASEFHFPACVVAL